ncbi:flagellar motor switch protein FliN [Lacrimispora sp. JR3]|uniref:flagellar motor switch protein FliN n=1 Tax=Lacrimispora sinapis TaxID=3111456 RepID=UPI003749CD6C
MDSKNFSAFEIDAIGEILNISLGASATAVSTMLNARVDITTPVVRVLTREEFEISNLEPAVGVEITYTAGLSGSNIMLLKKHDVKIIVDMMMGMETPEEEFELNELNISAICEVMNQMMGASATALSEFLTKAVNISTPSSFEIGDIDDFKKKYYDENEIMVVVGFTLKIADRLESEFINVMPPSLAKELVGGFFTQETQDSEPEPLKESEKPAPSSGSGILSQDEIEKLLSGGAAQESKPEPEPQPKAEPQPAGGSSGGTLSQAEIESLLAGSKIAEEPKPVQPTASAAAPIAGGQMPGVDQSSIQQLMSQIQMQQQMMNQMQQMILQLQNDQQNISKEVAAPKTINVKPVPQKNLQDKAGNYEEQEENRELIMGVPLEVSVEIGRTRKLVKDILEFTKGSLVVLDKLAGDQVDLYVNGRCIAKGDVVVVDDNFGIRITEIVKGNMM